jgi:hypothetical protein
LFKESPVKFASFKFVPIGFATSGFASLMRFLT